MTISPISAPSSSDIEIDWRHGGEAHPLSRSGTPLQPAPFLTPSVLAQAGVAMLVLGVAIVAIGVYTVTMESTGDNQMLQLLGVGFGGLTLSVVGGFLYAGSWVSCLVEDNRAAHRRLGETLLALADVTAQATAATANVGAVRVTVGEGTVVHRRDCPLIAYRPDLAPADADDEHLSHCRVCKA